MIIRSVKELGELIRHFRHEQGLTLEVVAGISHVGTRFLSELERGKETVELGKVLQTLERLGLEVSVRQRGGHLE